MSDFRSLSETMLASPQISQDDIAKAANAGVKLIICNRPDGESPDEPQSAEIESLANEHGIAFAMIPVSHAGFSLPQVEAMAAAVEGADGTVLAYCRSGTRSTLLWALARAKMGDSPDALAIAAQKAGYNVGPVRPTMDMLAGKASG